MIQALGILHLVHGPALIIVPFLYDSYNFNFLYLDYFYFMMFCYTFFDRECPITYFAKFLEDYEYKSETCINEYPEMHSIFPREHADKISYYFFASTTIGYISSLMYVIYRMNIPQETLIIPSIVLIGYFSLDKIYEEYFTQYQIFTRLIMLGYIITQSFNPLLGTS